MRARIAMLALLALAAAPAGAAAKPRSCAKVGYVRGNGYYVYESSKIVARRVTCARARRIARVDAAGLKGTDSRPRFRSGGFACRGRRSGARRVAFTCTRRKMRVTFVWRQR